jgi:hypothetical protein
VGHPWKGNGKMNLDDAKTALLKHQKQIILRLELEANLENQRFRLANPVEEAFRVFLSSNPDEDEFTKYLQHVTLTAGMLYWIWKMR